MFDFLPKNFAGFDAVSNQMLDKMPSVEREKYKWLNSDWVINYLYEEVFKKCHVDRKIVEKHVFSVKKFKNKKRIITRKNSAKNLFFQKKLIKK